MRWLLTGPELSDSVNLRDLFVSSGAAVKTIVPSFHKGTGDGLQAFVFVQQAFYSLNHFPASTYGIVEVPCLGGSVLRLMPNTGKHMSLVCLL